MRADIAVLGLTGFTVVFDRMLFTPSGFPYVQSVAGDQASFYYSLLLSLSALTGVIASLTSGFLAKGITMKGVFLLLQVISMGGLILYAFAVWPMNSVWAIILGRCLSVANGGLPGLIIAYAAEVEFEKVKRTALFSNLRTVGMIAALPAAIIAFVFAIPILQVNIGSYTLDAETYPPWCSFLLQLVSFTLNVVFLRVVEKEYSPDRPKDVNGKLDRLVYISPGVVIFLALFWFDGFILSSFGYVLPIVMLDGYHWQLVAYAPIGILMAFMGIIGAQTAKVSGAKLGSSHWLVIYPCLFYFMLAGLFETISVTGQGWLPDPVGATLFVFSAETSFLSWQLLQTSLVALFSFVVPPRYMTRMMPFAPAFTSFGSITGPLVSEFESYLAGLPLIFLIQVILCGFFILLVTLAHEELHAIEDLEYSRVIGEESTTDIQ